ncbi:unnamed protein product [Closterium sp. NIES-54]
MASVIFTIPIAVNFLASSLIVTTIQIALSIFVFPISPRTYRVINWYLMGSFWAMLIWLIEWWGRVEVRLYGDPKDHAYYGKESALCVSNHRSDVDWAIGWVFSQRCGCLGGTRALIKEEAKWMPVIGWSMWFSEYLFIARNYATDQRRILDGYARLRSFPRFFWVALFMEGTRFTPEKLKAAQEYAKEAGLPIPRHVLVPRTKGLVMSVEQMRGHAGAIYDFTVNYPVGKNPPTFANIFKRKASQIDVYYERVPMDQIPQDAEGISKWCQESFVKKDKNLDYYVEHNGFDEKLRLNTTKSPKSILHTCFWTVLNFVVYGWIFTRNLSSITFTWATLGWIAVGVAAVLAVVQVLLRFTQSEHSTPASRLNRGKSAPKPTKAE